MKISPTLILVFFPSVGLLARNSRILHKHRFRPSTAFLLLFLLLSLRKWHSHSLFADEEWRSEWWSDSSKVSCWVSGTAMNRQRHFSSQLSAKQDCALPVSICQTSWLITFEHLERGIFSEPAGNPWLHQQQGGSSSLSLGIPVTLFGFCEEGELSPLIPVCGMLYLLTWALTLVLKTEIPELALHLSWCSSNEVSSEQFAFNSYFKPPVQSAVPWREKVIQLKLLWGAKGEKEMLRGANQEGEVICLRVGTSLLTWHSPAAAT